MMMSTSARRIADIAKRIQDSGGVNVGPLIPSHKTDPVAWVHDKAPRIDSKAVGGVIPFKLWPYQEQVLRYFWEGGTYFIKKDRQMGFTTTLLAAAVPHKLLYGLEVQGVPFHFHVLADTGDKALDLLRMTKVALDTAKLDDEERRLLKGTDPMLQTTTIRYGMANYVRCHATTGKSVRGYSGNGVLVEEAAFIDDLPDVWKSVSAMVSQLGEVPVQPSVWLVSSPNGPSYHEELCESAAKWDAKFIPFDFRNVPGRDDEWEARERARLGDKIFEEEHGLRVVDSDERLFYVDAILRYCEGVVPLPKEHIPGHRYSKGLDVSGTAGVTVFVATDISVRPAQPVLVEEITGSFDEKIQKVCKLDQKYPGALHADGTWDSSFVGSLKGRRQNVVPVRFTGGSVIGSGHDAQEQLRWVYYPRKRMVSGTKRALGAGRVVVFEGNQPKLWKAIETARAHSKSESSGRSKRRGRHPDILDAFMLSILPLLPKREYDDGGQKPQRIRSGQSQRRRW